MLIGNRKIEAKIVNKLIKEIKQKRGLGYLADDFVRESLRRYLGQNSKKVNFLLGKFNERAGEYKVIVKEVRGELRKVYGLYKIQRETVKRREYFLELVKTKKEQKRFLELHKKILETHASSRERLGFYEKLYKGLFKITGEPKAILDLGCGINPFSIPLMELRELTFYAYDVDDDDISLINEYFQFLGREWAGFKGEAGIMDLEQWGEIKKLKGADICFLWKMTDVLERGGGHKASERVISEVPARFVVVSFPTFTIRGVKMNRPRRKWIELMCGRRGYLFKVLKFSNELFYVIRK